MSNRRLITLAPPTEEQHLIYRTMFPVLWVDSEHSVTGIKAVFNSDSPLSAIVSSTESYDILLRTYRMYNMTFSKVYQTGIRISNILHVAWTGHCRTQCTLCKSLKIKLGSSIKQSSRKLTLCLIKHHTMKACDTDSIAPFIHNHTTRYR